MLKGTLKNGFEFEIDEENLNDYEIIEMFGEVDENALLAPKLIKRVLGEEQKNKLAEHLRDKDTGKVPVEAMFNSFVEILSYKEETKN